METTPFTIPLYLPAQAAAETEATILQWFVAEGDTFEQGQPLAEVDSAKSVFDFEAPCEGRIVRWLCGEGDVVLIDEPILEIETNDQRMRDSLPPAVATSLAAESPAQAVPAPGVQTEISVSGSTAADPLAGVFLVGLGGYVPERIVTNAELSASFPDVSADYVHQVTGIRQRRWAAEDEKPSDMAVAAAREAMDDAGLQSSDIDALVLATTTPDVAMPSTACIVQQRLGLGGVPAFDLNAACSGWLYALGMADGMIRTGRAKNVLCVGVDVQSRLLDENDRNAFFLFGDGAGAAILAAGTDGHRLREIVLRSDSRGLAMAQRAAPGYYIANGHSNVDPWIRLDGHALFRLATESFSEIIQEAVAKSGWTAEQTRWVVPHQANGRILKAAARRCGIPLDRFVVNMEDVGNTSSASIPLALRDRVPNLHPGDRILLCSVGAGMTTAAVTIEW